MTSHFRQAATIRQTYRRLIVFSPGIARIIASVTRPTPSSLQNRCHWNASLTLTWRRSSQHIDLELVRFWNIWSIISTWTWICLTRIYYSTSKFEIIQQHTRDTSRINVAVFCIDVHMNRNTSAEWIQGTVSDSEAVVFCSIAWEKSFAVKVGLHGNGVRPLHTVLCYA